MADVAENERQVKQKDMHTILKTLTTTILRLVEDPRAARPYLFSDGQNMYNRVVLVCTVNVYIPTSLGRRTILRYQVPGTTGTLGDVWPLRLVLAAYKIYLNSPLNIINKNKVSDFK